MDGGRRTDLEQEDRLRFLLLQTSLGYLGW